ncbi:MAG: hypothetical protein V3T64_01800 [Myxococcota bacterium]
MRSDAIDQLLSSYLKQPAKVSWKGAVGDSVRGIFEDGRLELAGISVLALPVDRLVFEADRFQFTPGIPATIEGVNPRGEDSVDPQQLERWLARTPTPFTLLLRADGIEFQMELGGFPISRMLTSLEIRGGWIALKPRHAEFLGLQNRLASLFRAYLPLPRLAPQTRITAIRHAEKSIRFELTLEDFEDEITPGLIDRLWSRFVPFARRSDSRSR